MSWLRRWHENNCEGRELQVFREDERWTVALWLDWTSLGLEVSVERHFDSMWSSGFHDAWTLILRFGPLGLVARRLDR